MQLTVLLRWNSAEPQANNEGTNRHYYQADSAQLDYWLATGAHKLGPLKVVERALKLPRGTVAVVHVKLLVGVRHQPDAGRPLQLPSNSSYPYLPAPPPPACNMMQTRCADLQQVNQG